jgi:nicotinate-nucleotide adenylyltransferase
MNIGMFGGSFNPPHIAHLILAEYCCDALQLERLLFIPSAVPPHKENDNLLPAYDRLHLTSLAIGDNDRFEVSDIEIKRGGTSYTIDTIRQLGSRHAGAELYMIIGVDNLVGFHRWMNYRAILETVTVVAMNRPGFDASSVSAVIMNSVRVLDVPHLEISSTDIRERIGRGDSVRYMVPDAVLKEIVQRGYYTGKQRLKE